MFNGGKVGWGIFLSDPALVIAEDHIHDPVQAVFDAPMLSYGRGDSWCVGGERSDIEAGFDFRFHCKLAPRPNHDNSIQSGPRVAVSQPFDICADGILPDLQATMIFSRGGVTKDSGIGEIPGFLFREKKLHVVTQCALVALQSEDIIGVTVDNPGGDIFLATHGINSDDGTVQRQQVEQVGDRRDLIGFVIHLALTEDQSLA